MPDLLFGSNAFQTILILGRLCVGMKVLAKYIDPHGIKNKNSVKYPYPTGVKKMKVPL